MSSPTEPSGETVYADPGYQADGKKRYPIDSADHVRAAWSYIHVSANARQYTPSQVARIKARIATAAKKFDVDVHAEKASWLSALLRQYTRPAVVDAAGAPAEPEGAAVKQTHDAGYDAETQIITKNKKHANANKKHPFRAGEFPNRDGSSRCLMCGGGQPAGGMCNPDAPPVTHSPGSNVIPVAAADDTDAGKIAAGIDAGVDQALVLLRSTPDLPDYAAQARDVLQGIEPACDALLDYFGVTDPDDGPEAGAAQRAAATTRGRIEAFSVDQIVMPTLEQTKAFVEEINGKTILTTQASTAELAGVMTNHDHYLWTQGRLVGADEANRNGAYWSSGDLELGQTTVPYGPLNWLHEEKHVIGTIAAASFAQPGEHAADGISQNHIAIAAPIWRWLYPDEAAVVEMASETGKFWYSMECISKSVACVGDGGCGAEVGYFDYMTGQNGACAHMVEKSGTRRFIDPTFLGSAVIVPPVRPGWVGADASVMKQAAAFAGDAFDAAGRPDMSASEWEQLMAQVVRFATT